MKTLRLTPEEVQKYIDEKNSKLLLCKAMFKAITETDDLIIIKAIAKSMIEAINN